MNLTKPGIYANLCIIIIWEESKTKIHTWYARKKSTAQQNLIDLQGALLLTWINFNTSMDKYLHPL